jgi:hypothetical protein
MRHLLHVHLALQLVHVGADNHAVCLVEIILAPFLVPLTNVCSMQKSYLLQNRRIKYPQIVEVNGRLALCHFLGCKDLARRRCLAATRDNCASLELGHPSPEDPQTSIPFGIGSPLSFASHSHHVCARASRQDCQRKCGRACGAHRGA